jgi:tetratricopeptide (TPR) repeat protein
MKVLQLAGAMAVATALSAACASPETQKTRYFESGNTYAAQHQYDHAIVEYANAIRIDPKFGQARLKLAQTYELVENYQAAFAEYIRAADALPDDRVAQVKAAGVLLLMRRFEDARARAATLLAKDPKDVDALVLLANSLAGLKDTPGAVAQIEEALKLRPDDTAALMNLGSVRALSGRNPGAEAAFRKAVSLEPRSPDVHLALANYLMASGRVAEAEQSIKEALRVQPEHPLANRMLAALLMGTGRAELAEAPLKVLAAQKTGAIRAQLSLADYYSTVRRYDAARSVLAQLITGGRAVPDAEARLAAIDYAEAKTTEAHQRIDALIKRLPKYGPALLLKARWLSTEQKYDDALRVARAAVEADPESASAHYVLASVHDQRREIADAEKAYKQVVHLNPAAVDAQVQLSRLSLALGNNEAARGYAEDAKRIQPGRADARITLTRSLLAQGDLPRAEAEIAALLKALPDEPVVHALNGTARFNRGDAAGARAAFEKSLALRPGFVEALAGLTALDVRARQHPQAVSRVEAELAKRPDDVRLLELAARVYSTAGQLKDAEAALKHAVAVDPRFAAGYAQLARVYVTQNRIDEARAEYAAMAERDPSSVEARTFVGMLLELQKKPVEAKKWYQDALSVNDRAPVAANNLAYLYAEEGRDLDAALNLATVAKQGMPDSPQVDDTLGWVYYKRNMPTLALRPLEDSVRQNPRNAGPLFHLGLTYAKLGQKAKAREHLERALNADAQFSGADVARRTLATLDR